jgi:hypothetical protein
VYRIGHGSHRCHATLPPGRAARRLGDRLRVPLQGTSRAPRGEPEEALSLRLPGHWSWDFWFATDGEDVHVSFLHAPRDLGTRTCATAMPGGSSPGTSTAGASSSRAQRPHPLTVTPAPLWVEDRPEGGDAGAESAEERGGQGVGDPAAVPLGCPATLDHEQLVELRRVLRLLLRRARHRGALPAGQGGDRRRPAQRPAAAAGRQERRRPAPPHVWQSKEDWNRHRQERIAPAVAKVLAAAGITERPSAPVEQQLDVVDVWTGA